MLVSPPSAPPIETLDWSPLFYPLNLDLLYAEVVVSPPSLCQLCCTEVLQQPALLEELTVFLPPSLRREMLGLCLTTGNTQPLTPLLYCYPGPELRLSHLLPHLTHNPNLLGDMLGQMEAQARAYKAGVFLLELISSKIISISSRNPKAIRILDLSGFPVSRTELTKFTSNKFHAHEQLTIVLDIFVTSRGDSGWVQLLRGTKNFTFKVKNVFIKGMRESPRTQLLNNVFTLNPNLASLKLSSLAFIDWYEVRNTLKVVSKFTDISILELSDNNLFDSSPNDEAGRELFNKFLRKFRKLRRLCLSINNLRNRIPQILSGLNLTYLDVSIGALKEDDFDYIFSCQPFLTHLVLSQNQSLGAYFESRSKVPNLPDLEVLEVEDCLIWHEAFPNFLRFLIGCPSLLMLNLSYNTLKSRQLIQLVEVGLGLSSLQVCSQLICRCGAGEQSPCVCEYPGKEEVMAKLRERDFRLLPFDKEMMMRKSNSWDRTISFKAVRPQAIL